MSADMMLVCREEGTTYDGIAKKGKSPCFITETSMGMAQDAIGDYMQRLFCYEPTITEQINGITQENIGDIPVDKDDITLVKAMLETDLSRHKDIGDIVKWLEEHIDMEINIERW